MIKILMIFMSSSWDGCGQQMGDGWNMQQNPDVGRRSVKPTMCAVILFVAHLTHFSSNCLILLDQVSKHGLRANKLQRIDGSSDLRYHFIFRWYILPFCMSCSPLNIVVGDDIDLTVHFPGDISDLFLYQLSKMGY